MQVSVPPTVRIIVPRLLLNVTVPIGELQGQVDTSLSLFSDPAVPQLTSFPGETLRRGQTGFSGTRNISRRSHAKGPGIHHPHLSSVEERNYLAPSRASSFGSPSRPSGRVTLAVQRSVSGKGRMISLDTNIPLYSQNSDCPNTNPLSVLSQIATLEKTSYSASL